MYQGDLLLFIEVIVWGVAVRMVIVVKKYHLLSRGLYTQSLGNVSGASAPWKPLDT